MVLLLDSGGISPGSDSIPPKRDVIKEGEYAISRSILSKFYPRVDLRDDLVLAGSVRKRAEDFGRCGVLVGGDCGGGDSLRS